MTARVLCNVLAANAILVSPAVLSAHEAIRATFTATDDAPLVADYWTPVQGADAPPAPVVILLHMYRSDRSAWRPLVPALEKAGFAILALDLRGHGESLGPAARSFAQRVEDRDPALFNSMHWDVAAAVAWLGQRPEVDLDRVVLVGASVGCSVAIDYARRHQDIDAIALMTPGAAYLAVDSLAHIADVGPRTRILMLSSREEAELGVVPLCERVAASSMAALQSALKELDGRTSDDVTVTLARTAPAAPISAYLCRQGSVHGTRMFGQVAGVEERIASFLAAGVVPAAAPAAHTP